jgi:hypothetical protein
VSVSDQDSQKKLAEFRDNFPTLYHGTTAFDSTAAPIMLDRVKSRHQPIVYASHDMRTAATYAAIIKDHPHADIAIPGIDAPLTYLVVDHKEDYLSQLKDKKKLVLEFSNAGFEPQPFGLGTVFEWHGQHHVSVEPENIREFAHLDEILENGVQIFFTTETSEGTDILHDIRSGLNVPYSIGKMLKMGCLEWANHERRLSPAPEFSIQFQ